MNVDRELLEREIAHLSRQEAEFNASAAAVRGAVAFAKHLLAVLDTTGGGEEKELPNSE